MDDFIARRNVHFFKNFFLTRSHPSYTPQENGIEHQQRFLNMKISIIISENVLLPSLQIHYKTSESATNLILAN